MCRYYRLSGGKPDLFLDLPGGSVADVNLTDRRHKKSIGRIRLRPQRKDDLRRQYAFGGLGRYKNSSIVRAVVQAQHSLSKA
jgi:hypothetical protein